MASEWKDEDMNMIVTQVSVGGFGGDVSAKDLYDYLERQVGLIWRCRLKTSSTPSGSYPDYTIDAEDVTKNSGYEKVVPHAFVHFVEPSSAKAALAAAGRKQLVLAGDTLTVSLGPENPHRMNERRRTVLAHRLPDALFEAGVMAGRDDFVVSWRGPAKGADFYVDPYNATCRMVFTKDTVFNDPGENKQTVIKCDFKIEFTLKDVNQIQRPDDYSSLVLLVQLASSPLLYYRTCADDIESSDPYEVPDDDDPWIRTTDFTGAVGRCNMFWISIKPYKGPTFNKVVEYFRKHRVPLDELSGKKIRRRDECSIGSPYLDPFFCVHQYEGLSFSVLFLLNAVVHKGIFNQHQLTGHFFEQLKRLPEDVNLAALKHLCAYKYPVYDALRKLESVQKWLLKNSKLTQRRKELDDIVEVRRLVITPSKAYCIPPEVELANRVLRRYRNISDRFLRVTFMDEGMKTLSHNVLSFYPAAIVKEVDTRNSFRQSTSVFLRVRDIVRNGFRLCGRKYSFLAFSTNQLRDRSAWFFADGEGVRLQDIKNWMGKFTNKNVAKCAARMGLCFSSTYATFDVPRNEVDWKLEEIERNGYVFSDGIGIITEELAKKVAEKLQLSVNPPCAYQIRYAGAKGVIACWPQRDEGVSLHLRPSMKKFESDHTILEICSWTRFQPGFLNRQIVTLLSALGVEDEIFWNMQEMMIYRLNEILVDSDVAFDVLTASCGEQGTTAAIMLAAGFKPHKEPHLCGMLTSIRAAQLGDLRQRARLFVPSSRWLMGCLDELGELEQGQCFIQVSGTSLENCFTKHGSKFETKMNLKVVKGIVVIAKNPCLHPGDVRVLEAVDVPGLHHLYDCLVFPQKGDRPHTNEASGSDLDGDLYFVTWDESLIPPSRRSWPPMEYAAAQVQELNRPITQQQITDFFVRNMVNESLGQICNAHVVHSDLSEYGAFDEKCLKLAELAAIAVDFPKTGKMANMPPGCKPKLYPDFMGKEPFQSYKSKKILGKLYRRVTDASDANEVPPSSLACLPEDIPYDADLEIPGSDAALDEAWGCKCSYDGQVNALLGQYKVSREDEVVSGHIWSMPKYGSNKLVDMKERLKDAYRTLRKDFRKVFDQIPAHVNQLSDDERNGFYERKASAWYRVTYHPTWVKRSLELQHPDGAGESVMLSFPWIAADYLARIKLRRRGVTGNSDSSKPMNALSKYIVDRL
ncbi:unnamed protein product [Cuscuta campestris]|uniref:RNA-dependent RNA polymerase n=1 Tax=Cuscuta campestris TaxID=132261 RepID=A0A484M882_9ASTE|nr:unnamed protein product [Cuscuta campestris]